MPLIPPASLISFTASSAAFLTASPYTAAPPVIGPIPPIFSVSPAVAESAVVSVLAVLSDLLPHPAKEAATIETAATVAKNLVNFFIIFFLLLKLHFTDFLSLLYFNKKSCVL